MFDFNNININKLENILKNKIDKSYFAFTSPREYCELLCFIYPYIFPHYVLEIVDDFLEKEYNYKSIVF